MTEQGKSIHRGWYSRGYLPHRDHPGLLQAITYRLADSVSRETLERMREELYLTEKEKIKSKRRHWLENWLDQGHGGCILRDPHAARCVINNWKQFAGKRYDLIAWVVMPNHVHILIRVYEGASLAKIVQSWKSFTGRKIRVMEHMETTGSAVWMREYWDRFIRDEQHFAKTVEYIRGNPVKAGLVKRPQDWPWSSAAESESTFAC